MPGNQYFREYMDRYRDHVFVPVEMNIIIGKFLEKTKTMNQTCDSIEVVDFIDRFDIHHKLEYIEYHNGDYERGDIIEDKLWEKDIFLLTGNEILPMIYYDNWEDAFWHELYVTGDTIKRGYVNYEHDYGGGMYASDDIPIENIPTDIKRVSYNGEHSFDIPETVTHVELDLMSKPNIDIKIPDNVTNLEVWYPNNALMRLPKKLTHYSIFINKYKKMDDIPDSVTHLRINADEYYVRFDIELPKTVKYLVLCETYLCMKVDDIGIVPDVVIENLEKAGVEIGIEVN